MTNNPYAPPQSTGAPCRDPTWRSTLLVPFLSSLLMVPAGLVLIGALRRIPGLFTRPEFLLPLIAGSAVAAAVLRCYRSANGPVRALLAPPIGFVAYLIILTILRLALA
ncbi:hypothetical protein ACWKWK_16535 [Pseudoxanthomonas beigongshangi]|nr:hypothetical protein [Pseudoxanthomonas sp.]